MTYVRDEAHVVARALHEMAEAENDGLVPTGTHNEAVDSLVFGRPFGVLDFFVARQGK